MAGGRPNWPYDKEGAGGPREIRPPRTTGQWTETAQDHLDALYADITQDSPEAFWRRLDRTTRRSQQMAEVPLSGCRVPEDEPPTMNDL